MTVLFLPGAYDTSVRSLVKQKIEEWTVVSWNFPRAVRVGLATVGTLVEAVTLICSPPGCSLLYTGPWALAFTLAIRLLRSRDEFLGGREGSVQRSEQESTGSVREN